MTVEAAVPADIPVLGTHHRRMFEEIWCLKGLAIDPAEALALEAAYREKLAAEMPDGVCRAWLIRTDGRIVASGAVSLVSLVPAPGDLDRRAGYLHSIYTEPSHRHRHCATRIVNHAIRDCRALGIRRVLLGASAAGRRIYERAGFVAFPEAMRLFIKDDGER